MKQSFLMKRIISTEYLLAAVLTAIFFVSLAGFGWWWLFILFIVVDISAFGYLQSNRAGALTYNIGHSLIGPTTLIGFFVLTGSDALLFAGLVWMFHIFVDRALGYGMKHTEGFHHTHLGKIKTSAKKKQRKK